MWLEGYVEISMELNIDTTFACMYFGMYQN